MNDPMKLEDTISLALCRGAEGKPCPYALPMDTTDVEMILGQVEQSGWPASLRGAEPGAVNRHRKLGLSFSGCANGCSRPQIVDFGFIRACELEFNPDLCIHCGQCEDACPENALAMRPEGPAFDVEACLNCGRCARACPEEALTLGRVGFRMLVGGRLGRRPRFGVELPGILPPEKAAAITAKAIGLYLRDRAPGQRLGDVLFKHGEQSGLDKLSA